MFVSYHCALGDSCCCAPSVDPAIARSDGDPTLAAEHALSHYRQPKPIVAPARDSCWCRESTILPVTCHCCQPPCVGYAHSSRGHHYQDTIHCDLFKSRNCRAIVTSPLTTYQPQSPSCFVPRTTQFPAHGQIQYTDWTLIRPSFPKNDLDSAI